ncbi:MAG: nucleotide exchange factor GrpE, partial [Oliverpabstia sp.]
TEIDNSEKTHENDKEKEDLKAPKERDLWEQDIPVFDKIILNPGNEKQESGIIGIDFEERYTFITVMRNGTFISVKENGDMIPSVCTITRLGECLFGNRAVRYGKVHNESVLKLTKYCGNKAEISRHGFTFSAQYICTEFFRYLKELAESELKLRIDGALLTLGNVDMIYRWRIAQAAGNAGIKIKRIICKPLACALVNYIYEPLAEENVIVCSFDGSFISGVCLEVGDGVIEVLSREEMHMQKYKENLSGKIIELIQKLIHEGCMEANDIDRVMIFSNEPVPQNVIIDQAFQGKEKRVTLDTLFDQPVRGAAIDGGLLHGDRHCEGILLLDVCSHPIDIIVWRENDVEPETISFMKSNTTLPTKVIREIKVKSGESLDIYVLYREKDHIHIRNSLAKVHLDGTWIEGTTQVNVTLDVYSGERIDLEIENPNTNMKIKKHVYGFEYENKEDSDDITIEGVIKKVLSVGEGIEWGLRNLSEEERETPTGKGLIQVYKKWKDVMRELHITPIRAEGMYFDIQYHTAIMYVTDENLDANMIVEELQTGYMYHGKVIKPSFVKVAN